MKAIKVTFDNGKTLATQINGTAEEIRTYYVGNVFNLGREEDDMREAVAVEFIHPCGHSCEHEPNLGALVCPCSSGECKG